MGSYCSTSESEEGKLWPLPCFLASLFHYFWAPSPKSLLVFTICPLFISTYSFISISQISPICLRSSPAHFSLCVSLTSSLSLFLSLSRLAVSSFPLPGFPPTMHLSFPLSLPFYLLTVCIRRSGSGVPRATWQVTFFAPPSAGLISNFTLSTLSSFSL